MKYLRGVISMFVSRLPPRRPQPLEQEEGVYSKKHENEQEDTK